MGRSIRYYEKDRCYLVTNRCVGGQYYFLPNRQVNMLLMFWLIRAVHKYNIELIAFVVMANHFHLVVRAPDENLSAFMCYFQRNLSVALRQIRPCDGALFPKRFHCRALLSEKEVQDAVLYVYLNPLRAGITDSLDKWKGLTSWHYRRTPFVLDTNDLPLESLVKSYENYKKELSVYTLTLNLSCLSNASDIEGRVRQYDVQRKRRFFTTWKTRHPVGQTSDRVFVETPDRVAYREQYQHIAGLYRAASQAWQNGEDATFPPGTIPPGHQQTVKQV